MSNSTFLDDLKIVHDEIIQNECITSFDAFKRVKNYMYDHPNDIDVKTVYNWILINYKAPFLNPNLIDAFNITLPYLRQQEVYKNLPFVSNNVYYPQYMYSLLALPSQYYGSLPNFYKGCYYFFNEQNSLDIPTSVISEIDKYINENLYVIRGSKDNYDDLETELYRYHNALVGKFGDDFDEFKLILGLSENLYDDEIIDRYINKKLGNIGELFIYNKIKKLPNAIFTAKELGNGFGYDMYFQSDENNTLTENLIEVKTTSNDKKNNYFSLSENEYKTMLSTLDNKQANYIIYRVFLNNNKLEFDILSPREDNIFVSVINGNIEYELDKTINNKFVFNRKHIVRKLVKEN
ncbi:MAG: DUF3883 domain-containing protein [Bacilli bacterium]|nr:DUF3883 domain-containing protein [Bacilli bacterium]